MPVLAARAPLSCSRAGRGPAPSQRVAAVAGAGADDGLRAALAWLAGRWRESSTAGPPACSRSARACSTPRAGARQAVSSDVATASSPWRPSSGSGAAGGPAPNHSRSPALPPPRARLEVTSVCSFPSCYVAVIDRARRPRTGDPRSHDSPPGRRFSATGPALNAVYLFDGSFRLATHHPLESRALEPLRSCPFRSLCRRSTPLASTTRISCRRTRASARHNYVWAI